MNQREKLSILVCFRFFPLHPVDFLTITEKRGLYRLTQRHLSSSAHVYIQRQATHISRTTPLTVLCFKFLHSFEKVTLTTYYFYTFGVCFTVHIQFFSGGEICFFGRQRKKKNKYTKNKFFTFLCIVNTKTFTKSSEFSVFKKGQHSEKIILMLLTIFVLLIVFTWKFLPISYMPGDSKLISEPFESSRKFLFEFFSFTFSVQVGKLLLFFVESFFCLSCTLTKKI